MEGKSQGVKELRSQGERQPIKDFRDLLTWKKAHVYTVEIYRATRQFPSSEQFGLTNQLRRAAVSIVSNIAEGFGRRTPSDRLHFYDMARGSLHETQAQLLVALDVQYLNQKELDDLYGASIECHKILTGLINKTKEFAQS
jgi:four helix bundle protein